MNTQMFQFGVFNSLILTVNDELNHSHNVLSVVITSLMKFIH